MSNFMSEILTEHPDLDELRCCDVVYSVDEPLGNNDVLLPREIIVLPECSASLFHLSFSSDKLMLYCVNGVHAL